MRQHATGAAIKISSFKVKCPEVEKRRSEEEFELTFDPKTFYVGFDCD